MSFGFDLPKALDITNTAIQLESESWAVAQTELLKAWSAKNLQHAKPRALPVVEAATHGVAGIARSHCSAVAVWGRLFRLWRLCLHTSDHPALLKTMELRFQNPKSAWLCH